MAIEQKKVQDVLSEISGYVEEHINENMFRTMIIPVMIKSVESLTCQLTNIEKDSLMVAKQYWIDRSCNSLDLKQARKQLRKFQSSVDLFKSPTEYFRIEAILKILYTFEDWEGEAEGSLAYFGSDLLEAGIPLDFFYKELQAVFTTILGGNG